MTGQLLQMGLHTNMKILTWIDKTACVVWTVFGGCRCIYCLDLWCTCSGTIPCKNILHQDGLLFHACIRKYVILMKLFQHICSPNQYVYNLVKPSLSCLTGSPGLVTTTDSWLGSFWWDPFWSGWQTLDSYELIKQIGSRCRIPGMGTQEVFCRSGTNTAGYVHWFLQSPLTEYRHSL